MADNSYNEAAGSPRAHYAPPEDGPFNCRECIHFSHWGKGRRATLSSTHRGECDHPEVIQDAKEGAKGLFLTKDGLASTQAGGCCEYEK